MVEKECPYCGARFIDGNSRRRYCDDPDCLADRRAESTQRSRQRRSAEGTEPRHFGDTVSCVVCGGRFTLSASRRRYCSDGCRRRGAIEKQAVWEAEHRAARPYRRPTTDTAWEAEQRRIARVKAKAADRSGLLLRSNRRWTPGEDDFVRANPTMPVYEISRRLHRTYGAVVMRRSLLIPDRHR